MLVTLWLVGVVAALLLVAGAHVLGDLLPLDLPDAGQQLRFVVSGKNPAGHP